MAERTLVTLFWLAVGVGACSVSHPAAADDKVRVATQLQEPKAADHATAGDDHSRAGGTRQARPCAMGLSGRE